MISVLSLVCSLFGVFLIDVHSAHLGNGDATHMQGETDIAPIEEAQKKTTTI